LNRRLAYRDDDVNLEGDQLRRDRGEPVDVPLGKSVCDLDVATVDVTEITQVLDQPLGR
jgi:hypothetical protein